MIRFNKFFKILKILGISFIALYAIYFIAVAVFFDSKIFRKVASMTEDDQTFVQMHGVISWFPGFLHASSGTVFIADQNISVTINVERVNARFEILPFLKKRAIVTDLHVGDAKVDIGMKEPKQSEEYYKKYARPEQLDREKMTALVKQYEKDRLILDFKKITIDRISEVKGGFGAFNGEMSLVGGFRIQPKVEVEVYPSTVKFLRGIEGLVQARFETFRILDAPGNAVFPYVTADIDLNIKTDSLKLKDLSLNRLPGYSMDGIGSNGKVKVAIVKGRLQKGSFIETIPAQLTVQTPSIKAAGYGKIRWDVDTADASVLSTQLSDVKLDQEGGKGAIKNADLNLRLYGNELLDAFHGVFATIKMNGLRWKLQTSREKNSNFKYSGLLTGKGEMAGYAGDVPEEINKQKARATSLILNIAQLDLDTSFLGKVKGTGRLEVTTVPINMVANSVQLPKVKANVDLTLGEGKEKGTVKTEAEFHHLEHQMAPRDTWKGKISWTLHDISPLVEAVAKNGTLSGIVKTVAKVNKLSFDIDTELTPESTWLRFNKVQSSGIWSGYGSLEGNDDGLRGLFELKVLGMPVGIHVEPEKTEVKFLPSKDWYDLYLKSQQTVATP